MERERLPRRVALVLAGALLSGVVAGFAEAAGLSPPWAVVLGMTVAAPAIDAGLHPGHLPEGATDLSVALLVMTVGALCVGGFAAIAVSLAEFPHAIAIGGPAAAAYAGALAARSAIS